LGGIWSWCCHHLTEAISASLNSRDCWEKLSECNWCGWGTLC
jgi:hypothetical protein